VSELDDLLTQVQRLGVAGHVHGDGVAEQPCPRSGICISEDEVFSALVEAPGRDREVHVDVMTAFGVLSNLPDGAGEEPLWRELADIDRGA
jgi:hypothetical protein